MSPRYYTVDDSQWSTPALSLSPGWNMLRVNGSDEYINQTEVDSMRPLLEIFWNNSISWTTTLGSWTSIYFNGTSISAFGLAGPNQGKFTAVLDGEAMGSYTAQQDNVD
ncbi:hypothetical protein CNBD3170 [Cryptococcus deneoformans B-3501A]|uniref:Uncharacterized protein n=1 Tax=Cryptococcus deneoformans (strain JEC21 / ATCC MYA-565) TaxID=214684 RepID=Q5KIF2_CRYD1|nr:hypothetical protein CND03180 [Cryptococcus neoformans var. neoformans JEC21]XP_775909.1 hypothetical protein CNBD3170 [Cryptococcus neoformans var. neoformans B-3501A]AAW42873.2 hypothetical protein CND03180 [Cryptococcus neoformans var. neoformans JEC21]EAL21262.1 hypothetical protein CNBD3170 [Cryptococcus neoformans var. neoformans B-3501A]